MGEHQSQVPAADILALAYQVQKVLAGEVPDPVAWKGPDDTRREWLAGKSREELALLDALLRLLADGRLQAFYKLDEKQLAAFIALFDAEDLGDLKRMLLLGRSTLHVLRFLRAAVIVVASVVGGTVVFGEQIGRIGAWLGSIIRAIAGAKT